MSSFTWITSNRPRKSRAEKNSTSTAVQSLTRVEQPMNTPTRRDKVNTNSVKYSRPGSLISVSSGNKLQQEHRNSVIVSSTRTGNRQRDLFKGGASRTLGSSFQDLSNSRMNEGNNSFTLPRGFHSTKGKPVAEGPQTKDDLMLKPYVKTGPKRTAPLPPPSLSTSSRQVVTSSQPRRKAPLPPTTSSSSSKTIGKPPSGSMHNTAAVDGTGSNIVHEANDCLYELPSKSYSFSRKKPPLPSSALARHHQQQQCPPPVPNSPRPSFRSMSVSHINLMEDTDSIYEMTNLVGGSQGDSSGTTMSDESVTPPPPPLPPRTPSASKISGSFVPSGEVMSPSQPSPPIPPPPVPLVPTRLPPSSNSSVPPPLPPVSGPPLFKPPTPPLIDQVDNNRLQEDDAYMEMTLASTVVPVTNTNEQDINEGDDEYILMDAALKFRDKYLAQQKERIKTNSYVIGSSIDNMTIKVGKDQTNYEEDHYVEMSALSTEGSCVKTIPSCGSEHQTSTGNSNQQHVQTAAAVESMTEVPPPPLPPKPTTTNQTVTVKKHLRSIPKQRLSAPHLPPPPPIPVKSVLNTTHLASNQQEDNDQQQLYEPLSAQNVDDEPKLDETLYY